MTKTTIKRNKHSIERVANIAILFVMLIILVLSALVVLLLWGIPATINCKKEMDHIGDFAVSMIDSDYLEKLSGSVKDIYYNTPEDVRSKQSSDEYVDKVVTLIDDDFLAARKVFVSAREHADVNNLYILTYDTENGRMIVILDGNDKEKVFLPGQWVSKENGDIDSIDHIERVAKSDLLMGIGHGKVSGWTGTEYRQLYNQDGSLLGYLCITVTIDDLMRQFFSFIALYIPMMILVLAFISHQARKFVRKRFTEPINKLAVAASDYTSLGKLDVREETDFFERLNINTNDEIEQLWETMVNMEKDVSHSLIQIREVTAQQEKLSTELSLARDIQQSVLTTKYPECEEFDLFARMIPAKDVGGDFYDFFMIDDTHLAMVIADVSGKGIPAALFMMISKSILKNRALQGGSPSEILKYTNETLVEENASEMFVTIWLGILDTKTGVVVTSNAGHEYPFVTDESGEYKLVDDPHGVVCGVLEGMEYEDYTITIPKGGKLFVYTDGVAEAQNASEEFFGLDRIKGSLNANKDLPPSMLIASVKDDVDSFAGGIEQFDDITMLCLRYKG